MAGSHGGLMFALRKWRPTVVIEFPFPHVLTPPDFTHTIMGKMSMYSILHIVKTFLMLPAHKMDYLPTPTKMTRYVAEETSSSTH